MRAWLLLAACLSRRTQRLVSASHCRATSGNDALTALGHSAVLRRGMRREESSDEDKASYHQEGGRGPEIHRRAPGPEKYGEDDARSCAPHKQRAVDGPPHPQI